ncbi:MAG: hypothetical protein ACTSYS_07430, partial [Promethearchaeota archaeon]
WNEMAFTFRNLLDSSMFVLDGSDVKTIANSFQSKIKEMGFCQKAEIKDVSDSKVVVEVGDCIFASACNKLRGDDGLERPVCPIVALLYSNINERTGKQGSISEFKSIPEDNIDSFTISLEG